MPVFFLIGRPRAWLFQGVYERLTGRLAKAHTSWARSLAAAARLAMPYDQGLAHYEMGQHLATDDPARQRHLTSACTLFSRINASYDLARAQDALQQLGRNSQGNHGQVT